MLSLVRAEAHGAPMEKAIETCPKMTRRVPPFSGRIRCSHRSGPSEKVQKDALGFRPPGKGIVCSGSLVGAGEPPILPAQGYTATGRTTVQLHRLEGSAVSYRTLDVDDIAHIREQVLEQSGWGKAIVVDPENYARSFGLNS